MFFVHRSHLSLSLSLVMSAPTEVAPKQSDAGVRKTFENYVRYMIFQGNLDWDLEWGRVADIYD